MSSHYVLTDPSGPSPSTMAYVRSGRGGAGNTFRASDLAPSLPPRAPSPRSSAPRRFFSGIGGAGNVREAPPSPSLNLLPEDRSPAVGHVGRGGAGNIYRSGPMGGDAARRPSDASGASGASDASSLSIKARAWVARLGGA